MGRNQSMKRISTTPTRSSPFAGLRKKMAIVNPFRKVSKDKTPNKKKGKTMPNKKSPRFNIFASSTPNSGQKERRKSNHRKVFNDPKPSSPRVLINQYMSRGLLEPPVTIDLTLENVSEGDWTPVADLKRKRGRSKLSTPTPTAANSKRPKLQAEADVKSPGSIRVTPSTPALAPSTSGLDQTEDGELKEDESVQILERTVPKSQSPEIMIVAERRAVKPVEKREENNPQSLFNRWNIPGLRGRTAEEPRSVKERLGRKFATSKKKRASNKRAQDIENAQKRLNMFYAPPPIPTFDPNQHANTQFTTDVCDVSGGVYNFSATTTSKTFPRMGVSVSRQRLRSPTNNPAPSTSAPPPANFYNVIDAGAPAQRKGLRPIVIDGSNVAYAHSEASNLGTGKKLSKRIFSSKGIEMCVDYFKRRGHDRILVFVPHHRFRTGQAKDPHILRKLKESGHLQETPDHTYDDRYVVQYAAMVGGVVVSCDAYRDLLNGDPAITDTITNHKLAFTFVGDVLMFPQDPMGRNGPDLNRFLSFD